MNTPRTYLVTLRDRGVEVCVEVSAEHRDDAKRQARALHPRGTIPRTELSR